MRKSDIPAFLLTRAHRPKPSSPGASLNTAFLDRGIDRFAALIKMTYVQWDTAHNEGLFQKLDARVKVLFLLFFVVIVSIKKLVLPEISIGFFILILVLLSRLNLVSFYGRVLFFGFLFGFLVALPSCLNIIVKGDVLIPIVHLSHPCQFWVYHIPQTIGITQQGLYGVFMLTLRVVNSLSLSLLVIYTTPFPEIIRALKSLRVPDTFLMIITLSYKYIFIFAKTIEDIHLAKKSKVVDVDTAEARNWIAGRMAFLLRKTRLRCEDVFDAMLARGFTGDVALYNCGSMETKNVFAGALLLIMGIAFIIM